MAFARYNGGSLENQLGYFFGDNAFVSVAIDASGTIAPFFASGVIAPLAEFKRRHGLASGDGIETLPAEKITFEGVAADGTKGTTAALTNDAAYVQAYASQENLKRIVDTVQQRAVVAATSAEEARTLETTDLFHNATSQDADPAVGVDFSTAGGNVISFLIERANVFNQDGIDVYGQPTGVILEGRNLQLALDGISLLSTTATEVALVAAAGESGTNFGVKMVGIPGSDNIWNPVV